MNKIKILFLQVDNLNQSILKGGLLSMSNNGQLVAPHLSSYEIQYMSILFDNLV